jgi:hypothetical protein
MADVQFGLMTENEGLTPTSSGVRVSEPGKNLIEAAGNLIEPRTIRSNLELRLSKRELR